MNDEIQQMLVELQAGATERDADRVEDAIGQLEFFIPEAGPWPDELFDGVKRLMDDPEFLSISTSFNITLLIRGEWDALSSAQRTELRPILAGAFDKFGDWMGAFVLAGIFGERYADEAAFATLEALSSSDADKLSQSLAAYGIGRLARTVKEGPLYTRAVERLHVLANSLTPEVQQEAGEALERLKKK